MYTPGPQLVQQPQAPQYQGLPQAQDKPKAPAKAKAPGGDVGAFIQQLIGLSAYVKNLETQAHLIHLNYEGSNFLGVHAFLKDQYEAHLTQFDTLGEFIRSMDYLMPMSNSMLQDISPSFVDLTSYKGNEMLAIYYKNLEELGNKAKKLEPIAQKITALDIANYLADLVGMAFKAAWFVKATLRSS
jgi:DNA-binding ferritin-like protein